MYTRSPEKGQVFVILLLVFVVLLGFTALAVDGGMVYADRRAAQNAADAGALAGAWKVANALEAGQPGTQITYLNWSCSSPYLAQAQTEGVSVAIAQTQVNQYTVDADISDDNGVATACFEQNLGTYVDKYIDVTEKVTSQVRTSLIHFFFSGEVANTVTAVARIRPRTPLAFGYAVVALNQSACSGNQNGMVFGGSQTTTITNGGVFSNGCMVGNGSSFTANVIGAPVGYAGNFSGNSSNIHPSPVQQTTQLPASFLPEPDCSSLPNRTQSGSVLQPGVYNSISINNDTLTLQPGLYCLTSGSTALHGTGGTLTGHNVTFYLANGGVTINGNVTVDLAAPDSSQYAPAIMGILFYLKEGNPSTVNLTGNSDSQYVGVIYAPSGDIELSGTSGTNPTFATQLIGNNVTIDGNANMDIVFDGPHSYQKPALLDLQQ